MKAQILQFPITTPSTRPCKCVNCKRMLREMNIFYNLTREEQDALIEAERAQGMGGMVI